MNKYILTYAVMSGQRPFLFYADSIGLAKDHARNLCNDNMWEYVKVKRYCGTEEQFRTTY